jgi:hypothetical protein
MPNNIIPENRAQVCVLTEIPVIAPKRIVRVIKQGAVADMVFTDKKPVQGVRKISKSQYVVIGTGEIKEYQQTDTKQADSLRKTFTNLRQLINTNFHVNDSELFLTLTYAENMQDPERLYTDFDKFYKRLKYSQKDRELAYISIAEPQGRGAWHLHVLLKSTDGKHLYIDNRQMQELWGLGWTETKRLKGDNPGAYFVAYFQNTEEEHPGLIADPRKAKKFKKGGRLKFYPKDFKFFRTSRNIEKPVSETMTYEKVLAEYGQPIYGQAFQLVQDKEVKNTIIKQQFNKKR